VIDCADWVNVIALTGDDRVVLAPPVPPRHRPGQPRDSRRHHRARRGSARRRRPRAPAEETGYNRRPLAAAPQGLSQPGAAGQHALHRPRARRGADPAPTPDDGEVLAVETATLAECQHRLLAGDIDHALRRGAFAHLALRRAGPERLTNCASAGRALRGCCRGPNVGERHHDERVSMSPASRRCWHSASVAVSTARTSPSSGSWLGQRHAAARGRCRACLPCSAGLGQTCRAAASGRRCSRSLGELAGGGGERILVGLDDAAGNLEADPGGAGAELAEQHHAVVAVSAITLTQSAQSIPRIA